jgi:hypothetical protein
MDYSGLVVLLGDLPDLLQALGFRCVPHFTTLQKALRRLLTLPRANRLLTVTVRRFLGRRRGAGAPARGHPRRPFPLEDGPPAAGHREADSFGLRGAGELRLLVFGDHDGLLQPVAQFFLLARPFGQALLQVDDAGAGRVALHLDEHLLGLPLQGLAGLPALPGALSHGAMRAKKDREGTGPTIANG